jgi:glycogen(starch) synthase
LRILVLSNLYPPGFEGGYELGCSHVVTGLRDAGHEVRVVSSSGDGESVAPVLRMPPIFDRAVMGAATPDERRALDLRARVLEPANVAALAAQLDDFRPDVAYLWNLLGLGGFALLGLLQERGVPWVWHLMDAVPRHLCTVAEETVPALAAAFAREARGRYLACSAHVVGEIRIGGIVLNGPLALLPNWVVGELPPARSEFGDPLRIVSAVGVLGEHKGTDVLIEAAALVRPRRFAVDLYGREDDGRFRTLIEKLGVADVVRLRGLVDQAELLRGYRDYDVFAFPTARREPFAFAPLEAAAAGCVPLISDDSGNAEWMVDGVHCLKARRAPEDFAARLGAIVRGELDLAPIARRAQAIVREQFHLPALMPRIEAALAAAARAVPPRRDGLTAAAHAVA